MDEAISAKPTTAVTMPEKKARLSGDSVWVRTRDQTMLVEKQATQTRQAANPIQSPSCALLHGCTATMTPANPATIAAALFHGKPSRRKMADSSEITMGAMKTRM